MNRRALELQARREALIQRAAAEREHLGGQVAAAMAPWQLLGAGRKLWQGLRERPWAPLLPVAAALLLRRIPGLRNAGTLWTLWQLGAQLCSRLRRS